VVTADLVAKAATVLPVAMAIVDLAVKVVTADLADPVMTNKSD
jgi:hypothetical protein